MCVLERVWRMHNKTGSHWQTTSLRGLFSFWLLQLLEVSEAGLLEASQRLLEGRKELQEWFDSRSLRQLVAACGRVFVSLISAPRASWGRVEINFLPLGFISPSRWCFMIVNSIFRISVNRKDTVLKIKKRKSSNWSLIRAALRWF